MTREKYRELVAAGCGTVLFSPLCGTGFDKKVPKSAHSNNVFIGVRECFAFQETIELRRVSFNFLLAFANLLTSISARLFHTSWSGFCTTVASAFEPWGDINLTKGSWYWWLHMLKQKSSRVKLCCWHKWLSKELDLLGDTITQPGFSWNSL